MISREHIHVKSHTIEAHQNFLNSYQALGLSHECKNIREIYLSWVYIVILRTKLLILHFSKKFQNLIFGTLKLKSLWFQSGKRKSLIKALVIYLARIILFFSNPPFVYTQSEFEQGNNTIWKFMKILINISVSRV